MKVVSQFEVPAPIDEAWELLLDIPRVIPCMPGAELIDTVDDENWKARLSTRLGPMSLGFDLDVSRQSVNEASREVTLVASGRERSGRGAASATIVNSLAAGDGVTVAHVKTDLSLSGAVARFGRQGLVRDVAEQMTDQFAASLRRELGGGEAPTPTAAELSGGAFGVPAAGTDPAPADTAGSPAAEEPSVVRMIVGLILRRTIRRLQQWLAKVEGNA